MGFTFRLQFPGLNAARLGVAVAVLLFCGTSGLVFGQVPADAPKTMLALPPAPLLPATLGKLQRVAEGDSGDGLEQVDAADAPLLKEDGLKRFARSEYTQDGKAIPEARPHVDSTQHGTVTVYKFMDASGAVAAFDYFRDSGKRVERRLGDAVSFDRDGLVFRSGVTVVREDFNRGGEDLMRELIEHLPKASGNAALAPLLPTLLPAKGIVADSAKYALGPIGYQATGGVLPPASVGFDKSAETIAAKYKSGGLLTLILYPTPQIAGEHGRSIEAELKQRGDAAGVVKLRREGTLLALTTGAWRPAEAQAMVDGIHLHSEVTFDKPMPLEFHAEVQKTYSLLTSVAIFCGIGALAALVLGLFFGGGRALIRVLQGKPAASEPEFLRIDLRSHTGEK
jgi:hypothetical protein